MPNFTKRVINQAEGMLKSDKAVNVFEFTSFAPRPPVKARSATAKPEDKCELHPYAKIPTPIGNADRTRPTQNSSSDLTKETVQKEQTKRSQNQRMIPARMSYLLKKRSLT